MPELSSLNTHLHLAMAVGATIPFDVAATFLLMSELDGVIDLRLPQSLDDALQDEFDGLDDADVCREAVARAGLCHLIVALKHRLTSEAATVA